MLFTNSGRGAVRLARLLWEQEAGGSNPLAPTMAKEKRFNGLFGERLDGVIEAAHYQDGELHWVRAYERRGPTWSDHVLLDRETLIERLKAGKRFRTGSRIEFQGSEFEVGPRVTLIEKGAETRIAVEGATSSARDQLDAVPAV